MASSASTSPSPLRGRDADADAIVSTTRRALLEDLELDDVEDPCDRAVPRAQDAPLALAPPSPPSPPTSAAARPPPRDDPTASVDEDASTAAASAIPSFTSESPYLSSYIDREMRNLAVLTETLRDISARARTFGKCGALMAEATRRLSGACRLRAGPASGGRDGPPAAEGLEDGDDDGPVAERAAAVGGEMTAVLAVLGELLDEVASAQVSMCQSLEASLSLSLEAFAGVELNEATRLRGEADAASERAEASFARYMHGRHAERAHLAGLGESMGGMGSGGDAAEQRAEQRDFVASWNKLSDHVGSQLKHWNGRIGESEEEATTGRGDVHIGARGEPGRRLKNLRDRIQRGGGGNQDPSDAPPLERDPALATAEAAAHLRHNLERIRLSQANAELQRFQLLRRLDSIKTRRNFELGESTLTSLNGLRAYFHHCSDMVEGIAPRLARLRDRRAASRERHDRGQVHFNSHVSTHDFSFQFSTLDCLSHFNSCIRRRGKLKIKA